MNNGFRLALLALAPLVLASPSQAGDLPPGTSVSGGVNIVSDYRFRGISLSGSDPALQGTINLNHDSGFYVGTWASSIDGGDLYGHTEVDLYGGWSGEAAARTTFDVMLAYYAYLNGNDAVGRADYFEGTAKLTHDFGPLKGTVGTSYSWEQKAIGGEDNVYLFSDAVAPVGGTPLTLKAHVGYTDGGLAPDGHYVDWSAGVDWAVGPLTLGVAYVDTDIARAHAIDSAVIFSIGASF